MFLLQKRQTKYLNISVPHASRGSAGQCIETFLGFMCTLVRSQIHLIESYSKECAKLKTPYFHLEMFGLRVPLRLV